MRFSAPKQVTWWIAVVVGGLGILIEYGVLTLTIAPAFVLLLIGFALLAIATVTKGL